MKALFQISLKAATTALLFLVATLALQAVPYSLTDQAEAHAEAVQPLVKLLETGEKEKARPELQKLHEAGNVKATTLLGLCQHYCSVFLASLCFNSLPQSINL